MPANCLRMTATSSAVRSASRFFDNDRPAAAENAASALASRRRYALKCLIASGCRPFSNSSASTAGSNSGSLVERQHLGLQHPLEVARVRSLVPSVTIPCAVPSGFFLPARVRGFCHMGVGPTDFRDTLDYPHSRERRSVLSGNREHGTFANSAIGAENFDTGEECQITKSRIPKKPSRHSGPQSVARTRPARVAGGGLIRNRKREVHHDFQGADFGVEKLPAFASLQGRLSTEGPNSLPAQLHLRSIRHRPQDSEPIAERYPTRPYLEATIPLQPGFPGLLGRALFGQFGQDRMPVEAASVVFFDTAAPQSSTFFCGDPTLYPELSSSRRLDRARQVISSYDQRPQV